MCTGNNRECMPPPSVHFPTQKPKSKRVRIHVRIHRLNRGNKMIDEKTEKELELKNLKLYIENMSILKENEKLRKKASLLHQENIVLLSEFAKKFSHFDRFSTTLFLLDHHLHRH